MNIKRRLRQTPEAHTSALNDVLFILLFFFLIMATLANPNVIKLTNPTANRDTKAKQTVIVSIDPQQRFYVNSMPTTIDSLSPAIEQVLTTSLDKEPTIVINADEQATAKNIVAVMSAGQALKVKTVMAVKKPE